MALDLEVNSATKPYLFFAVYLCISIRVVLECFAPTAVAVPDVVRIVGHRTASRAGIPFDCGRGSGCFEQLLIAAPVGISFMKEPQDDRFSFVHSFSQGVGELSVPVDLQLGPLPFPEQKAEYGENDHEG
jgi:hypothetical protein